LAESTDISRGHGTSGRVARISSTFSVGRNRVGNVRATSDWVAGISVTFVSLLAESTNISRFDGTSGRVTLVGGTLGIRSYRVGNVETSLDRVARVSVTFIA